MTKHLSLLFAALFCSLIFFGNLFYSVEASPNEALITQISVISVEKLPPEVKKP